MSRQINDAGLALIKNAEGFRSNAYPDPATKAEPYTIGYGSTHYQDGTLVTMKDNPIDEPTASQLLKDLLNAEFCPKVEALLTVNVNDNQFAALCSLSYNIGIGNFKQSTVLRCTNFKNWQDAADSFLLWNKANGKVMPGLVARRQAESNLYKS